MVLGALSSAGTGEILVVLAVYLILLIAAASVIDEYYLLFTIAKKSVVFPVCIPTATALELTSLQAQGVSSILHSKHNHVRQRSSSSSSSAPSSSSRAAIAITNSNHGCLPPAFVGERYASPLSSAQRRGPRLRRARRGQGTEATSTRSPCLCTKRTTTMKNWSGKFCRTSLNG